MNRTLNVWVWRAGGLTLALGLSAVGAADVQLGLSRFAGMGGAGLALPFGGVDTIAFNAARYAYNKGFSFEGFNVAYQTSGVSVSDLHNLLKSSSSSGFGTANLSNIAQNFGRQDVNATIDGSFALGFGPFSLGASAGAVIATRPNAALKNWAKGDTSDITTIDPASVLDAYGYAYTSIDLGAGGQFGPKNDQGQVTVGGRVRFIRGYYSHYVGDSQTIIDSGLGVSVNAQAPELGTKNYLDKNSVGADFGTQVRLDKAGLQFAGVEVDNIVEPKVSFQGTDPGGSNMPNTFSAFRRQVNVGYGGLTSDKKLMYAVDVHDLGNHAGFQELRLGASYQVATWLAVNAGFGTVNGPAVGVQVFGISVSLSRQQPLTLSRVFRF